MIFNDVLEIRSMCTLATVSHRLHLQDLISHFLWRERGAVIFTGTLRSAATLPD